MFDSEVTYLSIILSLSDSGLYIRTLIVIGDNIKCKEISSFLSLEPGLRVLFPKVPVPRGCLIPGHHSHGHPLMPPARASPPLFPERKPGKLAYSGQICEGPLPILAFLLPTH